MDKDTALAILNEAAAGDYFTEAVPEEEEKIIALGTFYWEEAKRVNAELGMDNEHVQSIIRLGGGETKKDKVAESYPRRSSGGLSESDEREGELAAKNVDWDNASVHEALARSENLPIPEHMESAPVQFPDDLSIAGDAQIRKLSGTYAAYLARVIWLLSKETADLKNAKLLYENARGRAVASMKEKPKLTAVLDAALLDHPEVVEWKASVNNHEVAVNNLQGLKEIYQNYIDRLSREAAIRHQEWERSR